MVIPKKYFRDRLNSRTPQLRHKIMGLAMPQNTTAPRAISGEMLPVTMPRRTFQQFPSAAPNASAVAWPLTTTTSALRSDFNGSRNLPAGNMRSLASSGVTNTMSKSRAKPRC